MTLRTTALTFATILFIAVLSLLGYEHTRRMGIQIPLSLQSGPGIGQPLITPDLITVDTPTTITVTSAITLSGILPGGVSLVRTSEQRQAEVVGLLNDSGTNGDLVPYDGVYTGRFTVAENLPSVVSFYISVAQRGVLRRQSSSSTQVVVYRPEGAVARDLAGKSSNVFTGRVVKQVGRWNSDRTYIETDVYISVDRNYKGLLTGSVVLLLPGGMVDGRYSLPFGTPVLVDGERLLVFVAGPDSTSRYSLTDGARSVFHIDGSGKAVIDREYQSSDLAVDSAELSLLLERSARGETLLTEVLSAYGLQ